MYLHNSLTLFLGFYNLELIIAIYLIFTHVTKYFYTYKSSLSNKDIWRCHHRNLFIDYSPKYFAYKLPWKTFLKTLHIQCKL